MKRKGKPYQESEEKLNQIIDFKSFSKLKFMTWIQIYKATAPIFCFSVHKPEYSKYIKYRLK